MECMELIRHLNSLVVHVLNLARLVIIQKANALHVKTAIYFMLIPIPAIKRYIGFFHF